MQRTFLALFFAGFIFSGKFAYADVAQLTTLMQRNNCLACHMVDKRKYGPHMKEVAAKYAGKTDIGDQLAEKIKAGATARMWTLTQGNSSNIAYSGLTPQVFPGSG